jgi:hypothetical protein
MLWARLDLSLQSWLNATGRILHFNYIHISSLWFSLWFYIYKILFLKTLSYASATLLMFMVSANEISLSFYIKKVLCIRFITVIMQFHFMQYVISEQEVFCFSVLCLFCEYCYYFWHGYLKYTTLGRLYVHLISGRCP